ncbi:MAG: M12 family metallo-peptidase [Gammaproteobacteria bacterium]
MALSASGLAWSAQQLRVLHHEAVQLTSRAQVGAAEHVSFNAYGRRFELSVAPNERIRRAMNAGNTRTMPFEGSVDGAPGSWVRITRSASGWRGMIFDGHELYAIETAADIAGSTVEPLTTSGSAPVVYRLADALLADGVMACEIAEPPEPDEQPTAATAFNNLAHELHAQAATLSAMKQVRVGVVADYEFVTEFSGTPTSPEDAIVARMNIVDGIFSSQLGVKISLAPLTIFSEVADPFTKSRAGALLDEVRTFRRSSSAQKSYGITHLMTGRDLDGDTVGIAYIATVCNSGNADSLSEGTRSTTTSALIAAHEMGHNFGAPHDGESGSACASTPSTFLMAPRLNGSDTFSACSVQQIQPTYNSALCLADYIPPDTSLEISKTSIDAVVGQEFVASFVARASGDDASVEVTVSASIPASLTIQTVTANGGTCTTGAGVASCTLGTLAAGETRQIDLALTAAQTGTMSVNVTADASNDSNSGNNAGAISVTATDTPGSTPTPPTTPTPPATPGTGSASTSGGGGGGRMDLALLAMLGFMLAANTRRQQAKRAQL